nr:PREDICTED: B-cell lymphoma 3 protein-like [Lepisosteus oculatus]
MVSRKSTESIESQEVSRAGTVPKFTPGRAARDHLRPFAFRPLLLEKQHENSGEVKGPEARAGAGRRRRGYSSGLKFSAAGEGNPRSVHFLPHASSGFLCSEPTGSPPDPRPRCCRSAPDEVGVRVRVRVQFWAGGGSSLLGPRPEPGLCRMERGGAGPLDLSTSARRRPAAEEGGAAAGRGLPHAFPYALYPIPSMPQLLLQATPLPLFYPLEEAEDRLASEIAMTLLLEQGKTPAGVSCPHRVLHIAVVRSEEAVVRRLVDILLRGGRHLDIFNNLRQVRHGRVRIPGAQRWLVYRQQCGGSVRAVHLSLGGHGFESLGHSAAVPLGKEQRLQVIANLFSVSSQGVLTPLSVPQCGASVNAQSYSGNSALHSACGRGLVEAVRLLLRNGADSSLKNYHNDTALMVAKNKRVTDVLRGKGGRHLNPKPLEPPPDAPSPHSLSPSPHQHSADGTPAQSPGHAPLRSPLAAGHHVAPPPAPSPSHQTAVAPPTRSPISQSAEAERRSSPVETQEHAQQEHKRLKEDVPGNRMMTIPRVQFQFFPLGGGGYPSPLRDAVALPGGGPVPLHAPFPPAAVEFPKGYYIEPQYTSFLPLPPSLTPLPLVPAPLSHGLSPHPPVSLPRPSSRGSDSQSDASSMSMSSEGKGES